MIALVENKLQKYVFRHIMTKCLQGLLLWTSFLSKGLVLVPSATSEISSFKNCTKQAELPHAFRYVHTVIEISKLYFLLA